MGPSAIPGQGTDPKSHVVWPNNKLKKLLLYTFLLINLYAGQEATVRTGQGTTDWFQIGKGVRQGSISSP